MYLYVEMFDSWGAYNDMESGSGRPTSSRRVVKIKLTPEQLELIKPRRTGNQGKTEMYESVNLICLQDD